MVSQPSGHASLIGSGFGGYEVQALIGRGAMGTVYLARDVALGRPVALKVLLGSLAKNPSMVRGFYREAQAAAPLRHPGIVRVYTAGIEGGTPYIAMEYVPGEPLDRFLRRKGQVSWQAALYIGGQVAKALQCAHDAGIIHRDIKPANILLDRQGRVRLTDFGIARVCAVEQHGADPKIIGTPQYMSPEQCAGAGVTHSTDLYSLGVTIYQMIAGAMPFKADSPEALIRRIASEMAPRLNRVKQDVPDDVARLVAHLLEKDPEKRPASAEDVAQTIERLQVEEGGRSAIPKALAAYVREQAQDSPLRVLTPPPKDKSRSAQTEVPNARAWNRRVLALASMAVLVLGCATVASTWLALRSGPVAAPAPLIDACVFTQQADGSVLAAVPAKAFRAGRIGWAGQEDALLVEAIGQSTTMARGGAGILALRPEHEECLSVVSPAGASLATGGATAEAVPLAIGSGMRTARAVPSIVLGQRTKSDERKLAGLLYIQRWNEASPALNPAAAFASAPHKGIDAIRANSRCVHAVLRPDGGALCMVIDHEDGSNYLVEQGVYSTAPVEALAEKGPHIVPESVQYAPAGDRVLYIRHDGRNKQELWVTPVNGSASTLLAIGYFRGETAISPDGDRVAVAWSAAPGETAVLHVLSMADGSTLQRLGEATAGHDAWLPGGDALVVAARGGNGLRQLCLKDASGSGESRVLTTLDGGVGEVTAVSADGAWAAGIAEGDAGVRIVFVALAQASKSQLAAHAEQGPTQRGSA